MTRGLNNELMQELRVRELHVWFNDVRWNDSPGGEAHLLDSATQATAVLGPISRLPSIWSAPPGSLGIHLVSGSD